MPFLHLPIQSGSDEILKSMNRKHNKKHYVSIIRKIKYIKEDFKFSSDFIVGYPGETDQNFDETIKLVNEIGFINSYSFIFSPRPGTPASEKNIGKEEILSYIGKINQSIIQ